MTLKTGNKKKQIELYENFEILYFKNQYQQDKTAAHRTGKNIYKLYIS